MSQTVGGLSAPQDCLYHNIEPKSLVLKQIITRQAKKAGNTINAEERKSLENKETQVSDLRGQIYGWIS